MKKKLSVLVCLLLVVAMLAGCGNKSTTTDTPAPAATTTTTPTTTAPVANTTVDTTAVAVDETATNFQETITIVPAYKYATVDTMNTTASQGLSVYYLVYNNLVEYDTVANDIVPGLAESWDQVSPTEITFHLRKGVKFHDGSDFTADDVVFTFDRAKEQAVASGKIPTVDHFEKVDDYTVTLYLNSVDPDIYYRLPDGRLSILSKTAFETLSEEDAMMTGTGPFKYKEVVIDSHVTLERNDEYWGEVPHTKTIIFQEIGEAASRLIALESGDVDVIASPAATDLHYLEESDKYNLYTYLNSNLRYIGLNSESKPLDDVRVRQAIAYGMNRQDYITVAYGGTASEVTTMMNPICGYCADTEGYIQDIQKAKDLLAEAGYGPGDINIKVTGIQQDADVAFATVFQAQMKEIGINVEVDLVESATFTARVKPNSGEAWDAEINGWGGYTIGPDNALRYLYHSAGTGNAAAVNDPEYDAIIDEAGSINDYDRRVELYTELELKGLEDAYYIPICTPLFYFGTSADVQGMQPNNGLIMHLRDVCIPLD